MPIVLKLINLIIVTFNKGLLFINTYLIKTIIE
jgi:hypothetical protein